MFFGPYLDRDVVGALNILASYLHKLRTGHMDERPAYLSKINLFSGSPGFFWRKQGVDQLRAGLHHIGSILGD